MRRVLLAGIAGLSFCGVAWGTDAPDSQVLEHSGFWQAAWYRNDDGTGFCAVETNLGLRDGGTFRRLAMTVMTGVSGVELFYFPDFPAVGSLDLTITFPDGVRGTWPMQALNDKAYLGHFDNATF